MYKKEELEKYEYFQGLDMEYVLDALTGLVSRGYILGFAKSLIENKIPFAFGILDLDNFKLVNDNYGHSTGDECLINMADALVEAVGDNGVVGRYGGDEFVIIYFNDDPNYDNVYKFYGDIFTEKKVVRRTMCLKNVHIFVTATAGTASYPNDASDFDDLFIKADKALYRGKSKGRNCFIVYVDALHKDIDVNKKDKVFLPVVISDLQVYLKKNTNIDDKINDIINHLANILQVTDIIVSLNDKIYRAKTGIEDRNIKIPKPADYKLLFDNEDFIVSNQLDQYKKKSPAINRYLTTTNAQSLMCFKIGILEDNGYMSIIENRIVRIWQERESAISMYISQLIAFLVEMNKK